MPAAAVEEGKWPTPTNYFLPRNPAEIGRSFFSLNTDAVFSCYRIIAALKAERIFCGIFFLFFISEYYRIRS